MEKMEQQEEISIRKIKTSQLAHCVCKFISAFFNHSWIHYQ